MSVQMNKLGVGKADAFVIIRPHIPGAHRSLPFVEYYDEDKITAHRIGAYGLNTRFSSRRIER